jgi:hypothetical protein
MSEGFGFTGDIGAFFTQLGKAFSGGALPGEVVRDIARAAVSEHGDKSLGEGDLATNIAALRLADHWLDEMTTLPAAGGKVTAWSRAEWVEQSLAGWLELITPLAENLGNSMASAFKELEEGGQLPAEIDLGAMGGFSGPLGAIVKQLGGALFAQQHHLAAHKRHRLGSGKCERMGPGPWFERRGCPTISGSARERDRSPLCPCALACRPTKRIRLRLWRRLGHKCFSHPRTGRARNHRFG